MFKEHVFVRGTFTLSLLGAESAGNSTPQQRGFHASGEVRSAGAPLNASLVTALTQAGAGVTACGPGGGGAGVRRRRGGVRGHAREA